MFIVINKERIKTYFITIGTVFILFVIVATTNLNKLENSVQTSIDEYINITNNNAKEDANLLKIEGLTENDM